MAINVDEAAHAAYNYANAKDSGGFSRFNSRERRICSICDKEIGAYYCENRLYLVRCGCRMYSLVKAKNPLAAIDAVYNNEREAIQVEYEEEVAEDEKNVL